MSITAFEEEKTISAAGRPDIQKLIKMGMLKPSDIDEKTGQRRAPTSKYIIQTVREKNRETGKYEEVKKIVHMGHVENPDCKGWRIGLTPEKYWKMLEEQHHNHEFRGRKDSYAPELTSEETDLFSKWLDDNMELVEDKEKEDVPKHPVVRSKVKQKARKEAEKKEPKLGRPKKESPSSSDE